MPEETATEKHRLARLPEGNAVAIGLGVMVLEAADGRAEVTMTVRPEMLNSQGACHGGVIFTLADCALEYASNSHGPTTVAAAASIDFVRPVAVGTELTAICRERHRGRVAGNYDVEVADSDGRIVALFRARSHEIGDRMAGPE